MATVRHVRLIVTLDAVNIMDDEEGRQYIARLRKGRAGAIALRLSLRDDDTLWLEQLQQDSSGSRWWPVCRIPTLVIEVTQ